MLISVGWCVGDFWFGVGCSADPCFVGFVVCIIPILGLGCVCDCFAFGVVLQF